MSEAVMTPQALDAFVRDQLARLDAQRPGSARAIRPGDPRWEQAQAVLVASVAGKTSVAAEFVADLLDRRELVHRPTPYNSEALAEAADTGFVASVMAAAAWALASGAALKARRARSA